VNQSAVFVLMMATFGSTCACGASDDRPSEEAVTVDHGFPVAANPTGGAGQQGVAVPPDNSNSGDRAEAQSEERAGKSNASEAPTCTPTSDTDVPDDDFVDADCDGIDGERDAAIFVSPAGFDEDPGTPDTPVRSLNHAVAVASETGNAVYVCNGTYRENLEILTPVAVYGGYDCSRAWRRVKDWGVVESGIGVQLSVRDVNGLVRIERMAFRASDAAAPGQSSQAARVIGSTQVELVRVELATGNGAAGSDGRPGSAGTSTAGVSASGADASTAECSGYLPTASCSSYAAGGYNLQAEQRCLGGNFQATRGGQGGRGGNSYLARGRFTCSFRVQDTGIDGSPGEYLDGLVWRPVATSDLGRAGRDGSHGVAAAAGIGELEAGVYIANNNGSSGTNGAHGMPGRGGSGGLSTGGRDGTCYGGFAPGSGGGQGGAGGCAGGAASGGGAGGAGLGIAIVNSNVSLVWPHFTIGDGGRGGNGARGGAGQPGTFPGDGGAAFEAANRGESGEAGGIGGVGGDGGPGGGGPSIAILYAGAAPEVTGAVYDIGTPGDGGTSVSLGDAPPGVTGEVVSLAEVAQ
jgi:hypothetical protein